MTGATTSQPSGGKVARLAREAVSDDAAEIAASLTSAYPGPLVQVGPDGVVTPINKSGEAVAKALQEDAAGQLHALISQIADSGAAGSDFLRIGEGRSSVAYELLELPPATENAPLLILARDVTLERNLRDALIESRKRYKDLVECSSDFVWETDADGRFAFVTTRGALGFSPDHLVGREARSFLDRRRAVPEPFPFEARVAHEEVEVWFRTATGEPVCLLVSCTPLVSEDGVWEGARAICRDITEAHRRDAALSRARARDSLLASIVKAIRDEVEPDRMLETAAEALTQGLRDAAACWVLRAADDGELYDASSFGGIPVSVVQGDVIAEIAEGGQRVVEVECADGDDGILTVMAASTSYHDRVNGTVIVARFDRRAWSDDERKLLAGVADQLGIALQQIETQEELLKLSRTDGLTGLLNRRAFVDEIRRRTDRGASGALFYVDLDNFKPVNDIFGHRRGDEALRELASILREISAPADLVGRLGGDEFAFWCNVHHSAEARERAAALNAATRALSRYSKGLDGELGTSIGVALDDPNSGEAVDALFARADEAMYEAKRRGKATFAEAPPVEPAGATTEEGGDQ